MKKLTLNLPISLKPTKTVLLVAAGLVVFISIVVFGVIRQTQAEAVQAAETSRMQREAEASVKANAAYIQSLQEQLAASKQTQADAVALCSWIDGMAAQRRVVSPPLCKVY